MCNLHIKPFTGAQVFHLATSNCCGVLRALMPGAIPANPFTIQLTNRFYPVYCVEQENSTRRYFGTEKTGASFFAAAEGTPALYLE